MHGQRNNPHRSENEAEILAKSARPLRRSSPIPPPASRALSTRAQRAIRPLPIAIPDYCTSAIRPQAEMRILRTTALLRPAARRRLRSIPQAPRATPRSAISTPGRRRLIIRAPPATRQSVIPAAALPTFTIRPVPAAPALRVRAPGTPISRFPARLAMQPLPQIAVEARYSTIRARAARRS